MLVMVLVFELVEGLCYCYFLSFGYRVVGFCLVRYGRSNGYLGCCLNFVLYDVGFEGEGDVLMF